MPLSISMAEIRQLAAIGENTEGELRKEYDSVTKYKTPLESVEVCRSLVGGLLDYPHQVTPGFKKVAEAWDHAIEAVYVCDSPRNEEEELLTVDGRKVSMSAAKANVPLKSVISALQEASGHVKVYLLKMNDLAIRADSPREFYLCLSCAALIRNRLWFYRNQFKDPEDRLEEPFKDMSTVVSVCSQQIIETHQSTMYNSVLHDPEGSNWKASGAFHAGQHAGYCIQAWWLYMSAIRHDMYKYLPPGVARRIYAGILTASWQLIVFRYTQISPSFGTVNQYFTDLHLIFVVLSEFCVQLLPTMEELLALEIENKLFSGIHLRAHTVMTNLVMICSPLVTLQKYLKKVNDIPPTDGPIKLLKTHLWIHTVRPKMVPLNPSDVSPYQAIGLHLRRVAYGSDWTDVILAFLRQDALVSRILLLDLKETLGSPEKDWFTLIQNKNHPEKGCKGVLCVEFSCFQDNEISLQDMYTAVAYVVCHGSPKASGLSNLFLPLLDGSRHFGILDKTQVWNAARPSWFQTIQDLLACYLIPIVESLLSRIQDVNEASHDEEEINRLITAMMRDLKDLVPFIPPQLRHLVVSLETIIRGKGVTPLADSLPLHLIANGLFTILNCEEKISYLAKRQLSSESKELAALVGERLCRLERMQPSMKLLPEFETEFRAVPDEVENAKQWLEDPLINVPVAKRIVDKILSDVEGQKALLVLQRTVEVNLSWLLFRLGVEKMEEWESVSIRQPRWEGEMHFNPLYSFCHIGGSTVNHQHLSNLESISWDSIIPPVLATMNKFSITLLLKRRPEFRVPEKDLNDTEKRCIAALRKQFEIEEFKEKSPSPSV